MRIWSAFNFRGDPCPWTVSYTRAGAIEKALTIFKKGKTWKQLYREGWRVHRVTIEPI